MKFNPYPVVDVGGLAAQSAFINITRAEAEAAEAGEAEGKDMSEPLGYGAETAAE